MKTIPEHLEVYQGRMDEADLFGYNLDYLELNTDKGIDYFDEILNELLMYDADINSLKFKTFGKVQWKKHILNLMLELLGEEYKDLLEEFMEITYKTDQPIHVFDCATYYEPNFFGYPTINEFEIAYLNKSIGLAALSHEYAHGIVLPRSSHLLNDYFGNLHYFEFPSIMTERMFTEKLVDISKDEIDKKMNMVRYEDSGYHANTIISNTNFPEELCDESKKLTDFSHHEHYGYIISDIYSTYLFDIYMNDKIGFLKTYRKMMSGEMNILDFLKKYDVRLERPKVKNTYIKSLEMNR